jgi:dTDP-4-dehydrorhamnose reductase
LRLEWEFATVTNNRTLILGASGMLGSAMLRAFDGKPDYSVIATVRNASSLKLFTGEQQAKIITNIDVLDSDTLVSLLDRTKPNTIINCVGLIKQLSSAKDPLVALPINSLFPHKLARLAALSGSRLVHISTDCVFAGTTGSYTEDSKADASDLYGVSKHLGEVVDYDNAVTLRTSIIGRELTSTNSLVDWFLAQKGEVKGYDKAIFSGLPTCELSNVIRDVVIPNSTLKGLYHVSAKPISKYELLRLVAVQYRKDINIVREDQFAIDRSLASARFSQATGYVAPDWPELIKRMYDTDFRGDK